MCPNQLTAAITAAAAVLAENRSAEEIALLAAVFTQLGDTLTTIAAQQAICAGQKNLSLPGQGG